MFETVAPETFAKRSKRVLYESLPLSIAIHAIAIGAIVISAVWNVAFPTQSPKLVRAYMLTADPPPPPPPPPPPAPPKATVAPTPDAIATAMPDVAPTVIPDTIPLVSAKLPTVLAVPGAVVGGVEGGVEGGVIGGVVEGVKGGTVGGVTGGTVGGVGDGEITDGRVHIERDKPLPMHPVSQVYPMYPEDGRVRRYEDSLVVRYVIGKDGRIKEVTVLNHPERKMFEESAVKAIRNWRFRPMIKNGVPTEVVHELTVNFKLDQS